MRFHRDIVRETARKKRSVAAASRIASADVTPVTKRIDYGSSESSMMDDEDVSSEDRSLSQTSDVTAHHAPPKKIDFSSQRSEPDGEPHLNGAHSVVSSQQHGLFLENLSAPHFARAYSQDDMDFLTPLDQPVMHLSHPTTPSPLKKRQRRNDDYDSAEAGGAECIREEEVQNLTQDMTHMDVRHRWALQPPPSFSSDSMPSPLPPQTPIADATPAKSFLQGSKRRARPHRCVQWTLSNGLISWTRRSLTYVVVYGPVATRAAQAHQRTSWRPRRLRIRLRQRLRRTRRRSARAASASRSLRRSVQDARGCR